MEASGRHRTGRWSGLALLLVTAALIASGCRAEASTLEGQGLGVGDHDIDLGHDDRDRSYRVYVPASASPDAPVVLALHGGGGTGEQFQSESGFDAVADREGFIVVYPEGTGRFRNRLHTWNATPACCGYAFDNDVDDVGYLRAVIDDVADRVSIDADRVFMTGHSNGAMMTYRFAAEAPDLVAAIAPVAGALSVDLPQRSGPLPLFHIHSVDDPRTLYEGGEGPGFPGTDRPIVAAPVMAGIEQWARMDGCQVDPIVADVTVGDGADAGQSMERLVWECPQGADVEHVRLYGSGHGWPGVDLDASRQDRVGPATSLIDPAAEIWAFFEPR